GLNCPPTASTCRQKRGTSARPAGPARNLGYINDATGRKGGMTACGTSQTSGDVRLESAKRSPADIDQAAPTIAIHESTPSCATLPRVAAASFGLLARRSAQGKNGSKMIG